MSSIKILDPDIFLDQASLKALDDKGLLLKKPIEIGHLVVDRSIIPSPRVQGKTKITNRKKINAEIRRKYDEEK